MPAVQMSAALALAALALAAHDPAMRASLTRARWPQPPSLRALPSGCTDAVIGGLGTVYAHTRRPYCTCTTCASARTARLRPHALSTKPPVCAHQVNPAWFMTSARRPTAFTPPPISRAPHRGPRSPADVDKSTEHQAEANGQTEAPQVDRGDARARNRLYQPGTSPPCPASRAQIGQ